MGRFIDRKFPLEDVYAMVVDRVTLRTRRPPMRRAVESKATHLRQPVESLDAVREGVCDQTQFGSAWRILKGFN